MVFLLAATLPFGFLWLRYVFAEGATLLFYVATGYKFRPREDNPYLAVRAEEELEEFGLDGGAAEEPKEAAPACRARKTSASTGPIVAL